MSSTVDKDKKYISYSRRILREVKDIYIATKFQGDTALTIPPFFQNAGRENKRIYSRKDHNPTTNSDELGRFETRCNSNN